MGRTYTCCMHRSRLFAAVAAGAVVLSGCAEAGLSAQDAYKVGCPAIDAVAASGSAVGKVAVAGLEQLRDSGSVTGESKQWLDLSIDFLKDPGTMPAESKRLLVDGCSANGYTLQNVG